MALCVCKCLNVMLECEKIEENVEIGNLELTSTEQRDNFFSEKLLASPASTLKTTVAQPALVKQTIVGNWTLHSCLTCGKITHTIPQNSEDGLKQVLIPKSNLSTIDQMNTLKKSSNFSPVFNLLVPEINNDIEMKENIDTNNFLLNDKRVWGPAQHVIGTLSKQLTKTLQSRLEAVEDSVRQFRDQKYAEFEAYKDRAQRDHKILASIINKARGNVDSDGLQVDSSVDNGPPSPQLPPLQRRRLSSIKDAKKINHTISKRNRNLPSEEDSLDAEDLFELEGMESHNNIGSDQDDYDSDPEGLDDEGIHISRPRGAAVADIARSLPINMPFPNDRPLHNELDDDDEPKDIAASIKALARSVHNDVFELPRPRFSTQI